MTNLKNEPARVSIIVPVYNVEKYLTNCIESILAQTCREFELLLINDGSTDGSREICDSYKEADDRIIVIHQENKGQSAARNIGIEKAKAEWILFVDSDDLIHPQMLEFLLRATQESNVNMTVCGRIQEAYVPSDFYRERTWGYDIHQINEEFLLTLFGSKKSDINEIYWLIYPKLIRTSIAKKYPFCEGRIFEDNEVCCKWLVESERIAVLTENMYFYTCNPTGTMQSQFSAKKLDFLWALESQIEFYNQIKYDKMKRAIIEEYFSTVVWMGRCVNDELGDKKLVRSVMLNADLVYNKWKKLGEIEVDESVLKHIRKYAYPVRTKMKSILTVISNKIFG